VKLLKGEDIMADETLIDKEIKDFGDKLLEPFDPNCIKGASYDVRVGARVRLVSQEVDGTARFQWVALDAPGAPSSVQIAPGSTCIIQSLEKVHMRKDMKGRLALRAFHSRRLIFFPGGIIDPGYEDFLYLPMANMGDVSVELKYKEALVSVEFVRLNKEAKPYTPSETPEEVKPTVFDRQKLSKELQRQGESIEKILKRLETNETLANASQRILDMVVLAAVAAGAITAVIILFPKLSFPWNVIAVGVGAALGIGATATIVTKLLFRSRQN
jgi:deoxycytidine triphosphate deaminase